MSSIDIVSAADSSRYVVWTDDQKYFFYNPSKRQSVWKKPEELKNRPDVDQFLQFKPELNTGQCMFKYVSYQELLYILV